MTGIEIALLAASLAMSAAGMASQAAAARKAGNYSNAVAERNAQTAQAQAKFDSNRAMTRAQRVMASQRAAYGKSGVTLEGSAASVLLETQEEAELEKTAILTGGQERANALRAEGYLAKLKGDSASAGLGFQIGATVLGGASKAYGMGAFGSTTSAPGPVGAGTSNVGADNVNWWK